MRNLLHRLGTVALLAFLFILRILGPIALVAFLLIVGSIAYSTWRGTVSWYFRVDGQVVVNGQETNGYMHANTEKTVLLVTRTDDSKRETYVVSLGPTKTVTDCGEAHVVRFLPFPVENPLCSILNVNPSKVHDPPSAATVTTGRNFLEFSTRSGKKVRAQW